MTADNHQGWGSFVIGGEYGICDDYTYRRHLQADIRDYPMRGGDDFPLDYVPAGAAVERSMELGLYNCFRIGCNPTPQSVSACKPGENFLIIDIFRATQDYERGRYDKRFHSYDEFLDWYYDEIFGCLRRRPGRIWACAMGEMDSSCPWPDRGFRDGREAYAWWKKTFFTTRIGSAQQDKVFDYFNRRDIDYTADSIIFHAAALFSLHYYYHWGAPFVWLERGCGLSNLQAGIAFLRGAARQYSGRTRRLWGLDFSTHHPQRNQLTWYDARGRRRNGWTESLMARSWVESWLAGADFVFEEGSDYTHWVYDGQGNSRLSPAGECAAKFADLALRRQPDRGVPVVPAGLLLNFYHGFEPRHSVVLQEPVLWGGRLPLDAAGRNISNLLEMFFPGYNRAWGLFDKAFNPEVPWRSEEEYMSMVRDGHDMRPYEAGHIVSGPFGDSLDVLLDNAQYSRLKDYRLLFLGGLQRKDRAFARKLLRYVKGGGLLLASVEQLPSALLEVIGVGKAATDWAYDLTRCRGCGAEFGDYRYVFTKLKVDNGLELGSSSQGVPLVWEVPYGRGRVVLSGIPYCQDIAAGKIMPLLQHIFARYIRKTLSFEAEPGGAHLTVSRAEDYYLVGAFNNGDQRWEGRIRAVNDTRLKSGKAVELWDNACLSLQEEKGEQWLETAIDPFSFKIFRLEREKR